MSEFTNGKNGIAAVEKKKEYERGIELLTKALDVKLAPLWLLSRSQAYQNTKNFEAALADADMAYLVASKRTEPKSREQMIAAQYRRSAVLNKMGRYADSDACAVWSQQLVAGKKFYSTEDDGCKKNEPRF